MDRSGDGRVRFAEWSKEATKLQLGPDEHWSGAQEMDSNNDSYLSQQEFFDHTSKNGQGKEWIDLPPLVTTTHDPHAVDRDFIADHTTTTATTTTTSTTTSTTRATAATTTAQTTAA